MAKKNQHWEVVFRMQTQDEWMWKNLPFTLKFEDKEIVEEKVQGNRRGKRARQTGLFLPSEIHHV